MLQAIEGGDPIVTTGLILQELQQGFSGPRANKDIIDQFNALPFLSPDRQDPIDIAELRNKCRRSGVQAGTIDVLLAQLCIRHGLILLSTDQDFAHIAYTAHWRYGNRCDIKRPTMYGDRSVCSGMVRGRRINVVRAREIDCG